MIFLQGALVLGWLLMQILKFLLFVVMPILVITFTIKAKAKRNKSIKTNEKISFQDIAKEQSIPLLH